MKLGEIKIEFEKHKFMQILDYHIQSSEDALVFINDRLAKKPDLLPQSEVEQHEGYIMGLKFVRRLLEEYEAHV